MNGHYWTIAGHLVKGLRPAALSPSRFWSTTLEDERMGSVRLTGRLSLVPGSATLVVVVHGLGGSSDSPYTHHAAAAAAMFGYSSLRLNLRGADLRGEDFFHAGLGSDLGAVLDHPTIRSFERVFLFGYSLGGHVCLSYAASSVDPRVKALAAVCSPLDLAAAARAFDAPHLFTYRRHVLSGLKQMYREVSKRRAVLPASQAQVSKIRFIQDWDEQVVAPRYGFASKEHYYQAASVAPRLRQISVPTLLLSASQDPMVPRHAVSQHWAGLPPNFRSLERTPGGHISFPRTFRLGETGAPGLEHQVLNWMSRETKP